MQDGLTEGTQEGGGNWTQEGGAENETQVKNMKVITKGKCNPDKTRRRNRNFKIKQETHERSAGNKWGKTQGT